MENVKTESVFERRPKTTAFVAFLILLVLVLGIAEILLRIFGSLNINYYTGFTQQGVHEYPYGYVPINKDGQPDEEFSIVPGEKRVGYFGDSVTYGVGAGYGYRAPDLLQASYPEYRHWVLAQVGLVLTKRDLADSIDQFKLNSAIYLMNLNDIMSTQMAADTAGYAKSSMIARARFGMLGKVDEALRGNSYVYTYVRLGLKNALQRAGYETHGSPAYELEPKKYDDIVKQTAARVAEQSAYVRAKGLKYCVLLLPYEMQVSEDAAETYGSLGFTWEDGFLAGSTQEVLRSYLSEADVSVFDLRAAFAGARLSVGDSFVYNKGDKIDWNHPNRTGHELMAKWLATNSEFRVKCLPN